MNEEIKCLLGGAIVMFLAALALPGSAKATPITQSEIPVARYLNSVSGGITNVPSSNQFQGSNQPTTGFSISGSGNGLSGPTLFNASTSNDYATPRISAAALANAGASATAQSGLVYFVAFSGADGTIPVNLQASGGVDSTGGRAFLQLQFQPVQTGPNVIVQTLDITGGNQLLSISQSYMLTANALYRVIMEADGFSQGNGGAASAYLDPFFSAPAGYSVLTSIGIGNTSGVATTPIPATLPLFASGLAGFGVLCWRQKKTAPRAA